jgi:capsular polysaccharide biosynthesis protein
MPDLNIILALIDKVGLCGVVFLILIWHMFDERKNRNEIQKYLAKRWKGE